MSPFLKRKPHKVKLSEFIKTIAITSGYNQKTTYDIYTVFLQELRKHIKEKRRIIIPGFGEIYLQKSIILIKEQPFQFDKIRFRPAKSFKWYVNGRRESPFEYKEVADGEYPTQERTKPGSN